MTRLAAVYRAYGANGDLLYIGSTTQLASRIHQHAGASAWWREVETFRIVHCASRDEALAAEREAIVAERPPHNIAHHPERSPRRRANPPLNRQFRALRLNAGLNKGQLAREAGVSTDTIRRLEEGDCDMRPGVLLMVADYFGIQVTDLMPVEREAA